MTFRRYHIAAAPAPSRRPWTRVNVPRALSRCLNCGTCIDSCMYGVHDRRDGDTRFMEEPDDHLCRVCFRCVAECPVNALSLERNVEFTEAGNGLFKPEVLRTIADEAEAGRIPVTGACYRGPFGGQGVDGMWTDMSEIVRPTRDGIHGREYISTSVDIGARPTYLDFRQGGPWNPPREIPIPMILDASNAGTPPAGILAAFVGAAKALETYAVVPAKSWAGVPPDLADRVIVRLGDGEVTGYDRAAGIEGADHGEDGTGLDPPRKKPPHAGPSLRLPPSPDPP